tara:strand:- start:80 stop:487 length:408 start_codon:yes stop_codon:yes gene_type:complete
MNKTFHLDIITPTSIESFKEISYLRIPSLDGLIGIKAKHTAAIIGISVGEIKITANGKDKIYSTSGGFIDIKSEGVQLLIESVELSQTIDQNRAQVSLSRAQNHLKDPTMNIQRAEKAIKRAKNRLALYKKYHNQ